MIPNCIDPKTNERIESSETFRCRIKIQTLIELLNPFTRHLRQSVKDEDGQFSLDLLVGAIVRQDDGNIHVYGGSGSDEHYASWCFDLPIWMDHLSRREEFLEFTAYEFRGRVNFLLPASC